MYIDPRYVIKQKPSGGVIVTEHPEYGTQMWSLGRITHKHSRDDCVLYGSKIGSTGYRPLTNLGNRSFRICSNH